MSRGKIVASSFRAAWWLPGPHLQTLWPYLLRRTTPCELIKQRLELPDGDFVDLCWNKVQTGPLVVVFHGLEGSINSPYAAGIMAEIEYCGFRGVLMHFRGCSDVPNRLDRSYHSGDTGDIRYLMDYLNTNYPDTKIFAVGFSLGGNALLKYLGECGEDSPVSAAVAVSVPYLLFNSSQKLSSGISRIYQWRLVRSLRSKVKRKFSNRSAPIDLSILDKLDTFYKFDDSITAPLNGFDSADDYYFKSSSRQYLSSIKVPTLLLHANDDPFMTPDVLPGTDELSSSITLEIADKGGHVGFIGGKVPWKPFYWLDKRIINFIGSH